MPAFIAKESFTVGALSAGNITLGKSSITAIDNIPESIYYLLEIGFKVLIP